jgi:hypothetical protein
MIYKNDLIRLGFREESELGHDYLVYPLDLNLKLISTADDEDSPLSVEFEPPQINISFTDEDDVKSLIQIIERNK